MRTAADGDAPDYSPEPYAPGGSPTLVARSARAGAIQAINDRGLVRIARSHDCVVVVPKVVGDFVPEGSALVEVYGARATEIDERELRSTIALGVERTIEQDPAFAIRIMVDIAIRALSPAVNDPTTAVQVLGHLGELLRLVGSTPRPSRPERERGARCGRHRAHEAVGGRRGPGDDGDSRVRRLVDPGRPADASDARGAPRRSPPRTPAGDRARARASSTRRSRTTGAAPWISISPAPPIARGSAGLAPTRPRVTRPRASADITLCPSGEGRIPH